MPRIASLYQTMTMQALTRLPLGSSQFCAIAYWRRPFLYALFSRPKSVEAALQAHAASGFARGSEEAEAQPRTSSLHRRLLSAWEVWLRKSARYTRHTFSDEEHLLDAMLIARSTLCQFDSTAATARHVSTVYCMICASCESVPRGGCGWVEWRRTFCAVGQS